MKFILDSYAWVEYLEGSDKGEKVSQILTNYNDIYTLGVCLTEVISRVKRQQKNVNVAYRAITLNSKIINLDAETCKEAGLLHAEIRKKIEDFGLVDSILLAISKKLKMKIVSGDKHFKNFKEVLFLK